MTNFEYIKTLNKEELAVFLALQDVGEQNFDSLTNSYDKWLDEETEFNENDNKDFRFLYAATCGNLNEEVKEDEECDTIEFN